MKPKIVNNPLNPEVSWLSILYSDSSIVLHFRKVKLIFLKTALTSKELTIFGVGSASVHRFSILFDVWGPASELKSEIPKKIEIYASDSYNRIYFALATLKSIESSNDTFHIRAESDRLKIQEQLEMVQKSPVNEIIMAISNEYCFPFSKVETNYHSIDARLLSRDRKFSGFYGHKDGITIDATPFKGCTLVKISFAQGQELPKSWDPVEEALEYSLGLPLSPAYSSANIQGRWTALFKQCHPFIYPGQGASPVNIRTDAFGFMDVFLNFLHYSQNNSNNGRRSDLHLLVHNVYSSMFSYTAVQIVNLCFAIEWLSQELTPGLRDRCLDADSHKDVQSAIRDLELGSPETQRLIGLISLSLRPSTKQRLNWLMEKGKVSSSQISIWDSYRHRAAHGGVIDDVSKSLAPDRAELLKMFHSLVGAVISRSANGSD